MSTQITGIVLAGGRGRRMGGQDKGLLTLRGRPVVAYALDALRPQVAALAINANRNPGRYGALGVPVVADRWPGFAGPLAGVDAGLRFATTDWVVFVPCDAFGLPADLAGRLHAAASDAAGAAYATSGGDAMFTCCLLHRRLAPAVEAALRAGRRALRSFLGEQRAAPVEFGGWPAAGRNLNTPAQWRGFAA